MEVESCGFTTIFKDTYQNTENILLWIESERHTLTLNWQKTW